MRAVLPAPLLPPKPFAGPFDLRVPLQPRKTCVVDLVLQLIASLLNHSQGMLDGLVVPDPGAQVLERSGCVSAFVSSVHQVNGPDGRSQRGNFSGQSAGQGHQSVSVRSRPTKNDKDGIRKPGSCSSRSGGQSLRDNGRGCYIALNVH